MATPGITTDQVYWDKRYKKRHGISGDGSRGRVLAFKAHTYNLLADMYGWKSVVDFGCGDGFMLPIIEYERYFGYDISETCIEYCRKTYHPTNYRQFKSGDIKDLIKIFQTKYDVCISFDVTFHITRYPEYLEYLAVLTSISHHMLLFTVNETQEKMQELWSQDIPDHVYYRPVIDDLLSTERIKLLDVIKCPFDAREEIKPGNTFSKMYLLKYE